jgi:hypothetical protein
VGFLWNPEVKKMPITKKNIEDAIVKRNREEQLFLRYPSVISYKTFLTCTINVKLLEMLFEGKSLPLNKNNHPFIPLGILMGIEKTTEKEIREKYNIPDSISTVYDGV